MNEINCAIIFISIIVCITKAEGLPCCNKINHIQNLPHVAAIFGDRF